MARCECCGAPLEEGAVFCGECGTVIPKRPTQYNQEPAPEEPAAQPVDPYGQPTDPYAQQNNGYAAGAAAPYGQQPTPYGQQQPAQWTQNNTYQPVQQPWMQNNGYQQPTFVVPQRPLGKGGGVTMIVFGSILLAIFLLFMLGSCVEIVDGNTNANGMIGAFIIMGVTVLAGGLMLLLFGIRKIKNVNRYNANLQNR